MNPAEFRRGGQYLYTGGQEGAEHVTFLYPEINHYDFGRADGSLLRLCHSDARAFIESA